MADAEKLYLRRGAAISEGGPQYDVPEDITKEIEENAKQYDENPYYLNDLNRMSVGTRPSSPDGKTNPYEGQRAGQRERLEEGRKEFGNPAKEDKGGKKT